jgi:hypothetical protein
MGPGRLEFTMIVDSIVDLVDHQEVAGRVGDAMVRIRLLASGAPKPGARLTVHAEHASEIR